MAQKILYLKGGTLTNGMQPMQEGGTAPTDAAFATATGWIVAATAASNYSGFRANTERLANTFSTTVQPNTEGLVTGATGNAFRSPTAYSGTFAAANWSLTGVMRSVTAAMATGQQIRLRWRVYRSANADGTGATEITTSYTFTPSGGAQQTGQAVIWSNTVAGTGNTTANMTAMNSSWAAPAITLNNEYLFFVCALEMVAASLTGNTRDANFRENSSSGILTSDFTAQTQVSPTGFADTENFGTESIQLGLSPVGFAETEAFGDSPAELDVAPTGFADTEAFGTLDASQGGTNVTPTGFADTEAFGTPVTQLGAGPTGTADTEAFGTPAAQIVVSPTGFADTESFGTPGARLGAGPTGFVDTEAFGNETLQPNVTQQGLADTEAFGNASFRLSTGATGFADTEVFGSESVGLGAAPTGFADTEAFGVESVRLGADPTGFADTEAFGTPSAGTPPSGPAPAGFADVEAFGTPVIQLSPGPIGFADTEAFGTLELALFVGAGGLGETEDFGSPVIDSGVEETAVSPLGFAESEAFGVPVLRILVSQVGSFVEQEAFGVVLIDDGTGGISATPPSRIFAVSAQSRILAVTPTDERTLRV